MEWKASDGANKPLNAAIIYWLERGWVGSKGPVRMKREGEKQTLDADCKAEFKAVRQTIQRDYELIGKKGWYAGGDRLAAPLCSTLLVRTRPTCHRASIRMTIIIHVPERIVEQHP
jgi:hypothetical protein